MAYKSTVYPVGNNIVIKILKKKVKNKSKIEIEEKDINSKNTIKLLLAKMNILKTDFRLIVNTRNQLCISINSMSKLSATEDMNWSNSEIDDVKPICLFDVWKDEELNSAIDWKITQTFIKRIHQHKGIKIDFLAHRMQFIDTYQLLQLNEEGPN